MISTIDSSQLTRLTVSCRQMRRIVTLCLFIMQVWCKFAVSKRRILSNYAEINNTCSEFRFYWVFCTKCMPLYWFVCHRNSFLRGFVHSGAHALHRSTSSPAFVDARPAETFSSGSEDRFRGFWQQPWLQLFQDVMPLLSSNYGLSLSVFSSSPFSYLDRFPPCLLFSNFLT